MGPAEGGKWGGRHVSAHIARHSTPVHDAKKAAGARTCDSRRRWCTLGWLATSGDSSAGSMAITVLRCGAAMTPLKVSLTNRECIYNVMVLM